MTDRELNPCPFCGGQMRMGSVGRDWHYIEGDHAENCVFDADERQMMVPATDEQKALMVEDWNRRHV